MPTDEILTLEIEPPYIGSAVSPTVDIDETTDDITVTITDFRGEHSYTVEKTDGAIADAEQAAQNANTAATNANQTMTQISGSWQGLQSNIVQMMDGYAQAEASRASAENARVSAENERAQEWDELSTDATAATDAANAAAGQATSEAAQAHSAAQQAYTAISNANATISNISSTASQLFAQSVQATGDANAAATNANNTSQTVSQEWAATKAEANAKISACKSAAGSAYANAQYAEQKAELANTAAQQADAAREAIQDDLAAKADKDGYYPQLTAGLADTLMSGDTETAQFAQRTSDRDGMARVESLRGNTVKWNQYFLAYDQNGYGAANASKVINDENESLIVTKVNDADAFLNFSGYVPVIGHKYYIACSMDTTNISTGSVGFGFYPNYNNSRYTVSSGLPMARYAFIATKVTQNNVTYFNWRFANSVPVGDSFEVKKMELIDLTLMFGAGNEPATVEEFERMFPELYYPHDAGSLLSVNVEGIQSAGMMRTIPVTTYFPDGMRGVGTAYDELDFVNHKAVTRMGAVDLGTLAWTYVDGRFGVTFVGIKRAPSVGAASNVVCVDYTSVANIETAADKSIAANVRSYGNNRVYIKDSAYTDEATFKAAMSGVMLYYELATPTKTALPENLQATYPVEIGGIESIVIPTGEQSAPPTMAIVYGYDADGIRDVTQSIVAPVERGAASSNYGVGSYLVMSGILYRVTTAIATGETINPGTNCTATTVMAEIIRLTA